MKDGFTEQRAGSDVLLQEIRESFVAYRMVLNDPPLELDFQSHHELGRIPMTAFPSFALFGVSEPVVPRHNFDYASIGGLVFFTPTRAAPSPATFSAPALPNTGASALTGSPSRRPESQSSPP